MELKTFFVRANKFSGFFLFHTDWFSLTQWPTKPQVIQQRFILFVHEQNLMTVRFFPPVPQYYIIIAIEHLHEIQFYTFCVLKSIPR